MKKKKFNLFDAILGTVCLTLVCESVMPTAAIGNTQYFWWILLLIAFCLPYGMITAELGTTYPSEGGMYDWVKRAFGPKWAGRVAWNYWVNFPLWIASLAVAVTDIIAGMFNVELSVWMILLLQLSYVWIVSLLGTKRVGESKYIVNLGTFFKIVLLLGIGLLGLYTFIRTGESANPITSFKDLIPIWNVSDDIAALQGAEKFHFIMGEFSFISIILFNFMGFEVVGTWTDDMDDPKKDIPKALIFGGMLMALFYILPATGFNIALESNGDWIGAGAEIVVDVLTALFTAAGLGAATVKMLVIVSGCMFIYTFIANIASWSFGVNEVAKYAAEDGSMPKAFTGVNEEGVPYVASLINGAVASIIVILGVLLNVLVDNGFLPESYSAGFSLFFCLSWITLLVGYAPMFLAFLKLRKMDKNIKRPYKVPGSDAMIKVVALVPFVILIAGILFTLFGDFSLDYMKGYIPLFVGVILSFICEEILVARIIDEKVK
ncbi:MAG: APC family permease [Bacilli bacterium]|nr:APC family permease [Bacilli bacterium]